MSSAYCSAFLLEGDFEVVTAGAIASAIGSFFFGKLASVSLLPTRDMGLVGPLIFERCRQVRLLTRARFLLGAKLRQMEAWDGALRALRQAD